MKPAMTKRLMRRLIVEMLSNFILVFVPLPLFWLRRKLAGRTKANGDIVFYSHPDFVCTCHLVWIGWLVCAAGLYNRVADSHGWTAMPVIWLNWLWVLALLFTIMVLGLKFGRVACGFLSAAITIAMLGVMIAELEVDLPLTSSLFQLLRSFPMRLDWGVPLLTSLVLGVTFAAMTTWQTVNDYWILPVRGNYIEHVLFQQKARGIAKGAKSFVAQFDCLVRRYMFFDYGDIEVRSALGDKVTDRIEGIFFASEYADWVKRRLSITDVAVTSDEESEESELA